MSRLEEDKVLQDLTQNAQNGFCVDIGASDGITWSNIYALLRLGWRGVAIECDPAKTENLKRNYGALDCAVITEKVTPNNVSKLIQKAPREFDVLSLDIDGYDYFVLREVLRTHRPRHIIVEFNQCFPPSVKFSVLYDPVYWWGVNSFYGMSIGAAYELLTKHSYALCHIAFDNAIFSLAGTEKDLQQEWEKNFLNRTDGNDFPNFGQQIARNLMHEPDWNVLAKVNRLWPEKLGKFAAWI